MFNGNIVLIGTVPPPAGGDAMWALDYLKYNRDHGLIIPLVNTSLIGKRANSVDENRKMSDEVKRCFSIWTSIITKVSRKQTDIVHMNINCSPFGTIRDLISALILRMKRVPFVVHCHCNIEDQIGTGKLANHALLTIFGLSSKVIVLNQASYEYAFRYVSDRAIVVPNFITMDQFFAEKKIHKELKNIVFVGHVRKTKGIDELLDAANAYPEIKFTLVGPVTDDYSSEEIMANSLGNIVIVGSVSTEQVNHYLDQNDVFLFPSYTEGFSRSLVEAMARGLPCIATDVGSNSEMLEDKGGILIKSKDTSHVIEAIEKISLFETRNQMSKWNYEKALKYYSIESVMNTLYQIYDEVVNEGIE